MRQTTILPLWLLAAVIAVGVGLGSVALEVTSSVVVMSLATAASWPAVTPARRMRAARGAGPRFEELPSGDLDEEASGGRRIVAQLASVIGYLTVALGLGTLLADLEPDAVGALGAGELLALIAAAPVWYEIDARLGIRGARLRRDEERRLHVLAGERQLSTFAVITLSTARLRPLLLAGALLAAAVAVATALGAAGTGGALEGVALGALSAGVAGIASLPARVVLRSPFYLQVSADGVDPLGRGLVPWAAIDGFAIVALQGQRFLAIVLSPEIEPERAHWWRHGHRALGRRLGNTALSASLLYCGAGDEELFAALRAFADKPVSVDLG